MVSTGGDRSTSGEATRAGGAWGGRRGRSTVAAVRNVLLATDSDVLFTEIDAALGSSTTTVSRVRAGRDVRAAVIEMEPDVVLLDMQIGSMGGVAAALDLRLEEGAERLAPQRIVLLLDRDDDTFMARRSGADGWLVKPLEARRIERAVETILRGESFTEGPAPVEV